MFLLTLFWYLWYSSCIINISQYYVVSYDLNFIN